jgi:conjugative transfer pilus assembly protein TraH
MKRRVKRAVAILLASVTLVAAPMAAKAGIFSDLGSMVMSNSSAPSTLSTRDRVGLFMGGFTMAAPIQNVNLITFDPPRLDAGCGGIDLFGGSFSFINGQQLIQIFRAVAADAAGLAFKAAIKAISPSLDALLSEFQALLQKMNNLAKNSCQLAHLIMDPADQALSNAINGDGSVTNSDLGVVNDAFGQLSSFLGNANQLLGQTGANTPKMGNQVVKTVVSSGASSIMGLAGLGNVDGSSDDPTDPTSLNNRILYSLLGYRTTGVPCNDLDQAGQAPSTATPASGPSIGQVDCSGPPQITLDDIVKGGGTGSMYPNNPLNLYQCKNPTGSLTGGVDDQICTVMQVQPFNYQGVQGYVNNMLFGNPDWSMGIQPNSIIGIANSGVSSSFTSQQIQFLHQMGVPLEALLSKTSNPDTRTAIAERLSPLIVNCITAKIGQVLFKGATLIQTSTGFDLDKAQLDQIDHLRADYMRYQTQCNEADTLHKIVGEMNDDAHLMNSINR